MTLMGFPRALSVHSLKTSVLSVAQPSGHISTRGLSSGGHSNCWSNSPHKREAEQKHKRVQEGFQREITSHHTPMSTPHEAMHTTGVEELSYITQPLVTAVHRRERPHACKSSQCLVFLSVHSEESLARMVSRESPRDQTWHDSPENSYYKGALRACSRKAFPAKTGLLGPIKESTRENPGRADVVRHLPDGSSKTPLGRGTPARGKRGRHTVIMGLPLTMQDSNVSPMSSTNEVKEQAGRMC